MSLVVGDGVAWLAVQLGLGALFRIEGRREYVKARYVLPVVVELGHGRKEYGAAAGVWVDGQIFCRRQPVSESSLAIMGNFVGWKQRFTKFLRSHELAGIME